MKTLNKLTDGIIGNMQASLQLLPLIMNNIPQAVFWKDRDLVYLGCNQAFAKDAGFSSPEEIIGKTDFDMPWTDQAELYRADDRLVMESGQSKLNYEEPQTTPNGSTTWLSTSKIPVYQNGEVVAVLAMYEDITARKQAEKAVHESEERFRRFTEVTVEGMVFHEKGKIVDVNPAAIAMFGFAEATNLIGKNLLEFIAPESRELVVKQMQLDSVLAYEIQGIRQDGSIFPIETSTHAYRLGDQEIRASSIRDITERKQTATELRQSELRLSNAILIARMGYWDVDIDTQMFIFNDQYYRTFHATTTEEMGGNQMSVMDFIQRFIPPGEGAVIGNGMQEAIETKDPNFQVKLEAQNLTVQGELRWVSVWLTVEKDEHGRTIKLHGVNQDITERKQLELQVQTAFERRGYQVQISTEISQEVAAASELSDLFGRVVTLTKERLGYYHTQLLRYDVDRDAVVLINGYGEIGQKMLAGGHQMPMGEGLIGTAAASGETVLRPTLANDPDWHPNPLLPETQGEIAVPIKWQNTVLGVLDVQSNQAGALTDDDRLLFEGLCGQIAIAMHNAELVETVRQNEARLAEALRASRLANWEYDVEKDLFTFNDEFYSIFHTTAEKAGGYQISSARYAEIFVHPDDLEVVGIEIGKALSSTGRVYNTTLDHRILYEDGGIGYIMVKITVERDENGKITRYYGANQDVTERKQAEEALRINEALLGEALQIARLAHWEYDVEKDIFTFNDQFYSLFHTTAEQHGGYQLPSAYYAQHFVYPDDLPIVGVEIGKALNSTGRHYSRNMEHRILYADGGVGHMQVNISVERDENGKITRYYGANQDITERKKEQEALAERLEEINRLYRAMSHEGWQTYREAGNLPTGFMFDQGGLRSVKDAVLTEELFTNTPLAVPGGEVIGSLAIANDPQHPLSTEDQTFLQQISEQVALALESARLFDETQSALDKTQKSESALTEAMTVANMANWEFNFGTSKFTFSDRLYNMVGTTAKEMGGYELPVLDYIQKFIHPEDAEIIPASIQQALQSSDVQNFRGHSEYRLVRADGQLRDIATDFKLILDEQGKPTKGIGTFLDITERKHAEGIVAQRATQLEAVATVSTTASTVLDPEKLLQAVVDLTKERFNLYHAHIYLIDDSWSTLLLAAGAGEVGRVMVETGHAIDMKADKSLVARAAREHNSIIVNDVRSETGFLPNPMLPETRAEMAVPMIVGDKVIGVFDVQSDIQGHFTDEDANIYTTLASQVAVALQNARLYVEQAATVTQLRELDRLKSSFLANMSHELRTPLNSILGFADVMLEELDGPLTENMNNDLSLIYKNGQHLLHLINDVLDMAKIESGKLSLSIEKFNLQDVIEEVTSFTSALASEKNLALFIEPDSDHEVEIHADKIRLRQVLINLINNSIKFTDAGKISIHVTRETSNVLIRIKDTGIGIPIDLLESVFQEFTQVDTTTTRKAGGTGLGLPISRRLINMHNGRLWAESTGVNGEGSTFFVHLPIEANINEDVSLTVK